MPVTTTLVPKALLPFEYSCSPIWAAAAALRISGSFYQNGSNGCKAYPRAAHTSRRAKASREGPCYNRASPQSEGALGLSQADGDRPTGGKARPDRYGGRYRRRGGHTSLPGWRRGQRPAAGQAYGGLRPGCRGRRRDPGRRHRQEDVRRRGVTLAVRHREAQGVGQYARHEHGSERVVREAGRAAADSARHHERGPGAP